MSNKVTSVPLRQRIRSSIGAVVRRRMRKRRDQFLERAQKHCKETQQATLRRLLHLNAGSDFSRTHGLHADLSPASFPAQFPITDYETYRDSIQKVAAGNHKALLGTANKLQMFALTSGTTASIKHIPLTKQFVKDYRRGWSHWGITVHDHYPKLKLLKMVQLISSHQIDHAPDGTPCGNISGLVASMQNPLVQKLYSVPREVAGICDAAVRRKIAARFAVQDRWAGLFVTANPSSLISLLNCANDHAQEIIRDIHDGTVSGSPIPDKIRTHLLNRITAAPGRAKQLEAIVESTGELSPAEVWPDKSVLGVWTGGSVGAYLPELQRRFGQLPVRDHGLHASEGRMTIPIDDNRSSGILDIDSHYFEFIPESELESAKPPTLQAHQLQEGHRYGILMTTSSGFYRYNIFDVVQCTGFYGSTPLLKFLHKGARISSITGEKITESQVVKAIQEANQEFHSHFPQTKIGSNFTLTPHWGNPPGYELFVDAELTNEQSQRFEELADQCLKQSNCEYDEKRSSGRLMPIVCHTLTPEQWSTFQNRRLNRTGGSAEQFKHPFLLPDPKFEQLFRRDLNS